MDAQRRRCEVCNVEVHRASMAKHLRSKAHQEATMIIPTWMFVEEQRPQQPQRPQQRQIQQIPSLKQLAKQQIQLPKKELDKQIAKRMLNPYYLSQRYEPQYRTKLESHQLNHLNSSVSIVSKFDLWIELYDINNLVKEMSRIYSRLINQPNFKYQVSFIAMFDKEDEYGFEIEHEEMFINLKINEILTANDILLINIESQVDTALQNQEMKGSGWRFHKLKLMTIHFYKTNGLNGGSYVKLPIRSSAILNIKNNDNYCFIWSILAQFHPAPHHSDRVSNYEPYFNELNIEGLDFENGFRCKDIKRFEQLNDLSINVFELLVYFENNEWKNKIVPIEISKSNSERVVDLLLYKNHYALIKKLHVYLGKKDCKFVCRRCLSSFTSDLILKKHKERCEQQDIVLPTFPKESHLTWSKHFHRVPLYFRIYADFECFNQIDNSQIGNGTTNEYKQIPSCNGYYVVSELSDVLQSGYYSYFGENNVDWFVDEVIRLENRMAFYFKNTNKEIIMTEEDEVNFNDSNTCWFCDKPFLSVNDKVRDHCHLTGKYRGAAHQLCNINVKQEQSNFIPFAFHNLSKYDCHLFFKRLIEKKNDKVKFDVIPKTDEEYISVSYGCIRFIDSFRFLTSSLDNLVKSLTHDDLIILKQEFNNEWELLSNKLAYPYEYFKSMETYMRDISEIRKKDYFSKLTNKNPDDEEIERTNEIIQKFNIKNGKELTELYLKTDVILLADVFEKFIKVSLEEYKINPLYCVSLPGYTWLCGLKHTGINLQNIQDINLMNLLENNIRGGISSVMGDRYVKSDENKKILYIDANNLYGWAMSQSLPFDEIQFLSPNTFPSLEEILNTPDDAETGYFLEVDLKYPNEIKQKTKNFPFAPQNKTSPIQYISEQLKNGKEIVMEGVNQNALENFIDYLKKTKPKSYIPHKKLICDWTDKKKYLVHYRMLKFYVKHGMNVEKVHDVVSFKQKPCLKKYIDINTQKRNETKSDFEKDFYKLLNNAFFGKTMENVRNRIMVKFFRPDDERQVKCQSKLSFNGIHKTYENYKSFIFKPREVKMDKPIYLGFSVLELSKLLMYETYYDTLQPYFGEDNIH